MSSDLPRLRGLPLLVDPQPFPSIHPLDPMPALLRSSLGIPPLAVYHSARNLIFDDRLIQVFGYDSLSTVRVTKHVQTWSVRTIVLVYIPL